MTRSPVGFARSFRGKRPGLGRQQDAVPGQWRTHQAGGSNRLWPHWPCREAPKAERGRGENEGQTWRFQKGRFFFGYLVLVA